VPGASLLERTNLTPEAGGDFLAAWRPGGPRELQQASADYGNHALALTLLGKYLVKFCARTCAAASRFPRSPSNNRQARRTRQPHDPRPMSAI